MKNNKKIILSLLICSGLNCNIFSDEEIVNQEVQEETQNEETVTVEDRAIVKKIVINQHTELIRKSLPANLVLKITSTIDVIFKDQVNQLDKEELNKISQNITDQTIEKLSQNLAEYLYELEIDFETNLEKIIKLLNETLDKSQIYIEMSLATFEGINQELKQEYNGIKDKYISFYYVVSGKDWRKDATLEEQDKIKELEIKMTALNKIIKAIHRTKLLIKVADWTIYSKSPIAWAIRKHIGFQNPN